MAMLNSDQTKNESHARVTAKYDVIYKYMSLHWDFVKNLQGLNIRDKLDFVCYSWGEICRRNYDPDLNFNSWKRSLSALVDVSKLQVNCKVEKGRLTTFQSAECLNYVFNSCAESPDVIIELGGGIGHNLARVLCGSFIQNASDIMYVNAEFNKFGLSLSKKIFNHLGHQKFKPIHFNYYEPQSSLAELIPLISGKKVSLFSLTSIEQIPLLPIEFNHFLVELNKIADSIQLTFCEPVSFQYPQLMPSKLRKVNLELANKFKHNLNLADLLHRLIAGNENMFIHSFYPSIFRIEDGLDVSGLKLLAK